MDRVKPVDSKAHNSRRYQAAFGLQHPRLTLIHALASEATEKVNAKKAAKFQPSGATEWTRIMQG